MKKAKDLLLKCETLLFPCRMEMRSMMGMMWKLTGT